MMDPFPDPGGQTLPTKLGKSKEFSCIEVPDVLFLGLKATPVASTAFLVA
jgi:hypothetical protein